MLLVLSQVENDSRMTLCLQTLNFYGLICVLFCLCAFDTQISSSATRISLHRHLLIFVVVVVVAVRKNQRIRACQVQERIAFAFVGNSLAFQNAEFTSHSWLSSDEVCIMSVVIRAIDCHFLRKYLNGCVKVCA